MGWYLPVILSRETMKPKEFVLPSLMTFLQMTPSYRHGSVLQKMTPSSLFEGHLAMERGSNNKCVIGRDMGSLHLKCLFPSRSSVHTVCL